ncbi:unnamed protein product [Thlaspi arvense]|uniref:non-specific serine/threonine protein kinase n=1 Tax=Thlaspi arvense TaxID=13288 RepID=A0AAU9S2N4_THLAR|nr:unnamed protein product [Thlaspi arvense]
MDTSSPSLHLLLLVLLCLRLDPTGAAAQQKNQFIFNGFKEAKLHLDGNAKILPDGLLQLTNTSKHKIGHAFYSFPISFSDGLSFSTTFVFAMVPEIENISGHGIAFAISPPATDFRTANTNQYLGLLNASDDGLSSNHLLAIELDTIFNPEFGDIDDNHVGIDLNKLSSIAAASVAYYDERVNRSLKLISGKPMQVWIDYREVRNLMDVRIAPLGTQKPNRPLLSKPINLSSIILNSMQVGFSSSTGAIASNHYILGWSFSKTGEAQSLEISKLPSIPKNRKRNWTTGGLSVSLIIVSVLLVFAVTGVVYSLRRKKYEEIHEDWERQYGTHRFSYKDLYRSTNGFKETELLGVGGFGKVYKGIIRSSKQQIAVKKVSHDSKQGMKEFVAEIASIGRLRHRNLVQLLGYCRRRGELLLVYDFMPNGSLDKLLFKKQKPGLNWAQRFRIIKGVASALLYLHEEWEQVVLHRDIKASNVLLDADLNGRLGDFGLARLYDHGANPDTTHVVGTVGYLAPELTRTGKATTSTDVFAFGSFLLEIACGRRPIEPRGTPEALLLVDGVLEKWKSGVVLEASDPNLGGEYSEEEMGLVLKLGLLCSHSSPAARPSMRQVLQYLGGDASMPEVMLDTAGEGSFGVDNKMCYEFPLSCLSSNVMSSSAISVATITNESLLKGGR